MPYRSCPVRRLPRTPYYIIPLTFNSNLTDAAIQCCCVTLLRRIKGFFGRHLKTGVKIITIYADDDADGKQTAFYCPWIQDGKAIPFKTAGWQTVTIPFSEFKKYASEIEEGKSPTFREVVEDRNAATYRNFGMGFINTDFVFDGLSVTATIFKQHIYIDNWRVVPCKSEVISDFPDEEE